METLYKILQLFLYVIAGVVAFATIIRIAAKISIQTFFEINRKEIRKCQKYQQNKGEKHSEKEQKGE